MDYNAALGKGVARFRQLALSLAGLFILAVSLAVFLWGVWPYPEAARTLRILPEDMQLPSPDSSQAGLADRPTIPEMRLLELDWPVTVRVGDADTLRLEFGLDRTEKAGLEGSGQGTSTLDLYATHHVLAEASLNLAGMQIAPGGSISSPLQPGQAATFFWSIRPLEAGIYSGAAWLHLSYVPLDGAPSGGLEARRLLSAQLIEVQAIDLFGLNGPMARLLGGLGMLPGLALALTGGFPYLRARFKNLQAAPETE